MPHARTEIEIDDEILKMLSGMQYKALRYLVNRADPWGICFPGNQAVADGISAGLRSVEQYIPELNDFGLVAYLRRGEFDALTRQPLKNVLMVNPAYISLAEPYRAEAQAKWDATGVSIRYRPNQTADSTTTINQFHQPIPKREPTPRTTTTQPTPTPKTTKGKGAPELTHDPTAARENDQTQDAAPTSASTAKRTDSDVPAGVIFRNPMPIPENLPDAQHEKLALKLRALGIRMPLARGFVCEHGVKACEDALINTLAAHRETDGGLRSRAGFFRAVLQGKSADPELPHTPEDESEGWDYK